MGLIEDKYNFLINKVSDINEHFPTLKKYALECESITEMGVRAIVSTWALLAGKPKRMTSIDIQHPNFYGANIDEVYKAARLDGINFIFQQASTLEIIIEETDLLFIDTLHTYIQLKQELNLHGNKAKKYIIMHDTEYCPEMIPAINEFLSDNKQWKIKEVFVYNNGLTILEKIL